MVYLMQKKLSNSSQRKFTYWSLLGLSPGSNSIEVRQAFKKEAMRWHPDLNMNNKNAEERFKWINEAYKVLSDPQKRLEWEVSGRPSFEIKEFYQQKKSSEPPSKPTPKDNSTDFNTAEKFLLILILIFCLSILNWINT